MGDEAERFSEKWDFRRKENNFDDSSGDDDDDPDSNTTQDPIIHNPNPLLVSNQLDNGTETLTRDQPVKTRKRRSKKDESKPEKAKQVRRRKPKTVPVEEKEKEKEKMVMDDGVGMFMETLLDDLKASREGLMDWMKTELYGSDQNVASQPPLKKRAQRSVKRKTTKTKKKVNDEEEKDTQENQKQSKPDEKVPEMNKAKEKSAEIAQNIQQLDCNAGPLDRFLKTGQGGLGRNYFQQQQEGQEAFVERSEIENSKNETMKNPKSIVLAMEAQNSSQRQKKTSEANTVRKKSTTGSESHKFVTPFAPNVSLSSSLQCFPIASSFNSSFPSSGQGTTSLASNNYFQEKAPIVSQIPDPSQFQTGFTEGQGFGNSPFHNNGYFSCFPAAFQPSLIPGGYNFPAQVNPASSSQQREDNSMFGGVQMAGGAIRLSGSRYPQAQVGNNGLSFDYRTGSGR